jgi:hypothetical protein
MRKKPVSRRLRSAREGSLVEKYDDGYRVTMSECRRPTIPVGAIATSRTSLSITASDGDRSSYPKTPMRIYDIRVLDFADFDAEAPFVRSSPLVRPGG